MSKYNNVNPGQYKVAGRERPDTIANARLKSKTAVTRTPASEMKGRAAAKPPKRSRAR